MICEEAFNSAEKLTKDKPNFRCYLFIVIYVNIILTAVRSSDCRVGLTIPREFPRATGDILHFIN